MTAVLAAVAALLTLAGALLLFAGAPNQRLIAGRRLRWPLLRLGMLAVLVGLVLLLSLAGPATAVFIWLTLAMLVWSVVPLAAAWRQARAAAS